jgi:hypothetical protein
MILSCRKIFMVIKKNTNHTKWQKHVSEAEHAVRVIHEKEIQLNRVT